MRSRFVWVMLLAMWAVQPAVSFSQDYDSHGHQRRPHPMPTATPVPTATPNPVSNVSANPVTTPSSASDTGTLPNLPNHLQCLDNRHQTMAYNNAQVINWEKTTQDQFHDRGLVRGKITKIYANQTGHAHFAIDLGNGNGIEVIYQLAFGAIPTLQIGMDVSACGDYITVGPHAQLPSPMPAIIHWVHWNPGTRDGGAHPGGFIVINNVAYGLTGNGD